jgi:hypothetical protein
MRKIAIVSNQRTPIRHMSSTWMWNYKTKLAFSTEYRFRATPIRPSKTTKTNGMRENSQRPPDQPAPTFLDKILS